MFLKRLELTGSIHEFYGFKQYSLLKASPLKHTQPYIPNDELSYDVCTKPAEVTSCCLFFNSSGDA